MSSKPTTSPSENRHSGSLSPCDSILIDYKFNLSEDSFKVSTYNLIPYESVCGNFLSSKESQTDSREEASQDLNRVVADLQAKCKRYKKQNYDLRREIKAVQDQKENEQVRFVQEEISRLRGKIQVHQMMAEMIVDMISEMSDDFECSSSELADFRVYSVILAKIDLAREKFREYEKKVKNLENDKISMAELLNFYTSTTKLLKNHGKESTIGSNQISLTPDLLNHVYTSRKSSSLSENTLNTIRKHIIKQNKNKGSSECEGAKKEEAERNSCLRSTMRINKDEKNVKRIKNRTSTSPLIPKPQKVGVRITKDFKGNALRQTKTVDEEAKQKKKRYKS